jgi:hypothetical protein
MYRLIYKSRSVQPLDWKIVKDITSVSEVNNEGCGVTGVLLASRTHFLQALEGNFEDVNAVFRRIVRDQRHENLSLIGFLLACSAHGACAELVLLISIASLKPN